MPKAARVCSTPGCPTIVTSGHCAKHQRPSSTARGYNHQHRRLSEQARAEATHCATCGAEFTDDNPSTGGHVVAIRHGGTAADGIVAQCQRCNYGYRKTGH